MTSSQKLSPTPSSTGSRSAAIADDPATARATSPSSGRILLDQSRTVGRVTHSPSRPRLSNRISNRQRRRLELPVTPFPFNRISNSNRLITVFLRRVSGFEGFRVSGVQALMIQTQRWRRLEGLLPRPAVRNPRLLNPKPLLCASVAPWPIRIRRVRQTDPFFNPVVRFRGPGKLH